MNWEEVRELQSRAEERNSRVIDDTYPGTACKTLETKLLGDLGGAHGVLSLRSVTNLTE